MSRTIRSLDGISLVKSETLAEQKDAIRRAIRYGVLDNYRNIFDTKAAMVPRRIKNGLPKTKHRARRIQVICDEPIYVNRRESQQWEEEFTTRWPAILPKF